MKKVLFALSLALTSSMVSAQTIPNMIGTWAGSGNIAVYGSGLHHPADDEDSIDNRIMSGGVRFRHAEYEFVIDQQEGHMFAGTGISAHAKSQQVGTLGEDLKSGVMVNTDGAHLTFQLDGNVMNACGTRARKEISGLIDNAFCYKLRRQ